MWNMKGLWSMIAWRSVTEEEGLLKSSPLWGRVTVCQPLSSCVISKSCCLFSGAVPSKVKEAAAFPSSKQTILKKQFPALWNSTFQVLLKSDMFHPIVFWRKVKSVAEMLMPSLFCHIEEKITKRHGKNYRGITFLRIPRKVFGRVLNKKGMRSNNKQIWEVQ